MYCPKCGNANPEQDKFCGQCGTPVSLTLGQLEERIQQTVETAIGTRFRDQRLVSIETADDIADRFFKRVNRYSIAAGLLMTVLLLILATLGISTYRDFAGRVRGTLDRIQPKLDEAEKRADAAIGRSQEATAKVSEIQSLLDKTQAQVAPIMGHVQRLEQQAEMNISQANEKVTNRLNQLNDRVEKAVAEVQQEQKRVESTGDLVKTLYSNLKTQNFQPTVTGDSRSIVAPLPTQKGGIVFMLLADTPIPQTLLLQFHVYLQPRGSYQISKNLVIFTWGDPVDNLKQHPIEATYIPDPTAKSEPFKALRREGNAIFADGQLVFQVPPGQ
jgi:hypothetical protein